MTNDNPKMNAKAPIFEEMEESPAAVQPASHKCYGCGADWPTQAEATTCRHSSTQDRKPLLGEEIMNTICVHCKRSREYHGYSGKCEIHDEIGNCIGWHPVNRFTSREDVMSENFGQCIAEGRELERDSLVRSASCATPGSTVSSPATVQPPPQPANAAGGIEQQPCPRCAELERERDAILGEKKIAVDCGLKLAAERDALKAKCEAPEKERDATWDALMEVETTFPEPWFSVGTPSDFAKHIKKRVENLKAKCEALEKALREIRDGSSETTHRTYVLANAALSGGKDGAK